MLYDSIEGYFKHFEKLPKCDKKEHWEKVFKDMAVHTRKRKPDDLLLKRRPNEDEKILKYRLDNYEPITYGSMNKALDDISRIISGISYTIDANDAVKEYLTNHYVTQYADSLHAEMMNVKMFIEKICLKRDIEDPNGFLIWMPAGEGLIDSSVKVTPEPQLILSEELRYVDDFVFIYESEEHTPLKTHAGEMVDEGEVYYFLTKNEVYKFYQVGTVSDPQWESLFIYKHNIGTFPVIVLGGDINSEGYYDSYFAPYLAFANEAIRQFSDWQAIMTTSAFPIREVFAKETFIKRKKVNKQSNNPDANEENYVGGGANDEYELVPMAPNPHGEIHRKVPDKNINNDDLDPQYPAIRYINPDVSVAKYSGESWELLIKKAEQALNIDLTVGTNQSGEAKRIDKEAQYAMISKIANNFFDNIYLNSLRLIDGYLNRVTVGKSTVSIAKPASFYIKSEDELSDEIGQMKQQNVPQFFLAEATLQLAKKRFNGNKLSEKIFEVIAFYDPLYTDTDAEKSNKLAGGVITKEDYINSVRMFSILNQIASQLTPTAFIAEPHDKLYARFLELVKPFYPVAQSVQYDENGNPI